MAWNRVRLRHVELEERKRLLSEVELLASQDHKNILRMLKSWVKEDADKSSGDIQINFITEKCTDNLRKRVAPKIEKCSGRPEGVA